MIYSFPSLHGYLPIKVEFAAHGRGLPVGMRGNLQALASDCDRFHHFWGDDVDVWQGVDEGLGRLCEQTKGAEMAGDHGFEVEIAFGGIGGSVHVHGEMSARAKDADVGFVVVPDPIHVGHDVGVTRDVDAVPFAFDDEARFGSCANTRSVGRAQGGGMHCVDHRDRDIADFDGTAFVHADGFDFIAGFPPVHQVELANKDQAVGFGQGQRVSGVVVVGVGQQNVRRALYGGLPLIIGERRVSVEPRIDEDDLICDL